MVTLVDSNVILDLLVEHPVFTPWSEALIYDARSRGQLCINQIILAEVSHAFSSLEERDEVLATTDFVRENLPWEAASLAGAAFVKYKKSSGEKRSPLPDFYIGAHAASKEYKLLTRDPGRYRSYFPSIEIIAPDTHP